MVAIKLEPMETHSAAAVRCNKRKAVDLIEGEDLAKKVRVLTSALESLTKKLNEREKVEEQLVALVQKVDELKELNSFDRSHDSSSRSYDEEEDDELLEDDETVVREEASNPWMIMFHQLRQYRILHGHCKVLQRSKENPKLGSWVKVQREHYRNRINGKDGYKIKPERIAKLETLGFCWGKKFPAPPSWEDMYGQLEDYQRKFGNCRVPVDEEKPTALAKWMTVQRKEYKRFKTGRDTLLTTKQIRKLNDLGMEWKTPRVPRRKQRTGWTSRPLPPSIPTDIVI